MATIKDIAKLAGVSHGTVSNVLNKRGNVSAEKIRAVEEAAKALGYELNESARNLRRQHKNAIALLIPDIYTRHYIDFYESMQQYVRSYGYSVEVYATDNHYIKEQDLVRKMVSASVSALVSFPTYIHDIEIYSKVPKNLLLGFVGGRPKDLQRDTLLATFDYKRIGLSIASYILGRGYRQIAIFVDSIRYSDEFVPNIQQSLERAGVSVTVFSSTHQLTVLRAFDIVSSSTHFDAIVTANPSRARAILQAHRFAGVTSLPHIITLSSEKILPENDFTHFVINYKKLGQLMGEQIIRALTKKKCLNTTIKLDSDGVTEAAIPAVLTAGGQLRLLASDDASTAALQKLLPHFERYTGIKVSFSAYPPDSASTFLEQKRIADTDLIIAPMDHLAAFQHDVLMTREQQPAIWETLNNSITQRIPLYFPEISVSHLAYSFTAACQMLFYRRDVMEDQRNRRRFYEQFYVDLSVPKTLKDFDRLSSFFQSSASTSMSVPFGIAMSSPHTRRAWSELLWRLHSEGVALFSPDGRVSLNNEGTLQAFKNYLFSLSLSSQNRSNKSTAAIDEFILGKSTFAILSTADAPAILDNKESSVTDLVNWAAVPGSIPIKSGNFLGISRTTEHLPETTAFLNWIYSENIMNIITLLSGMPISKEVTQNSEILHLYPWLQQFNTEMAHGRLISQDLQFCTDPESFRDLLLMALINARMDPTNLFSILSNAQNSINQ